MGGSFTLPNWVTVNGTNATIYLTGLLNNTNATLALNPATGSWVLQGGTISGGAITTTNGAALVVQGGTLDAVTVNGTLDVGNSVNGATLTVTDGLVLNGTALVGNPTNSFYGRLSFAGTQTLSGNGAVVFGNNGNAYNALQVANGGTTLIIGAGIEVHGQTGQIGYTPNAWGGPQDVAVVNQGAISADVSGGTIAINGQPFGNQGLAQAVNGGNLALNGTWGNSGTLAGSNGALYFGGSFTLAHWGAVNGTNATIYVTGLLNNTNTTLALNPATGSWVLQGGTISGGAITTTNGAALIVQGGTLDAVTVNGTLDVGNSVNGATLTVTDGLVLNGTALVGNQTNSWYGRLSFAGTQTLSGNGAVVFGNNGNAYNALQVANGGATLIIGAGIEVHGQTGQIGYTPNAWGGPQDVAVVNQGAISADVSGGTITINGQPFSNQGVVESPAGTLNLAGTLGTGGLGNIQRGNGPLLFSGALTNTGQTLMLNGATNLLTLSGGTISGGAITTTNGAALIVQGGTLDGVTVNGTLDVGNSVNGATLTVADGLVLNGTALVGNSTNSAYGRISFAGTQTLSGSGAVVFGNNGNYSYNTLSVANGGTTLTIGPGITIGGQNGVIGCAAAWGGPQNVSVVNQGTVSADVSGGTIYVVAQLFSNQGLAQGIQGGALSLAGGGWSSSGVLNVATNSTLSLTGNGMNSGALNVTNGTVNLGGSLTTAALGAVNQNGGAIYLAGALDNTASSLVLQRGPWVLNGGTIHNGTVVATNGTGLLVSGGTLDGVTVNGVLDVGRTFNAASLAVVNGLVLNGTAYLGWTNGNYGAISFAWDQTLGGNGTVIFGSCPDPRYSALLVANSGTTLVIGPEITVRGQNGTLGYSSAYGGPQDISVINQGAISADVAGGTINLNAQPFINQGLAESPAGALVLGGDFTNGPTGILNSGAGELVLGGVLDNAGQTLALNGATNVLTLNGGRIAGGSVLTTNGGALVVQRGTLDGVTVNGVLDVGRTFNGASLAVVDGLVLNGTAYLGWTNGNYGAISFAWDQTLGGNGMVIFGSYPDPRYNALLVANSGTTLVIGPGITVRGQNGTLGYSSAYGGPQDIGVVNQGAISADVAGGTINLNAQPFINQGLAESPAGVLVLGGDFTNGPTGILNSGAGELVLGGVLDNAGQTLALSGATNVLTLNGGRVAGGSVLTTNGGALVVQRGTLDGVTVNGVLDVGRTFNGASLAVVNGLVLNGTAYVGWTNGNYGAISFVWDQTLGGNGTLIFGSCPDPRYSALLVANSGTTLVIGPEITVRGQNGTLGYSSAYGGPQAISVINQGAISADVAGSTITVGGSFFSNSGQLRELASGGSITVTADTINTGLLEVDHGVLTFNGDFDQSAGALDFRLNSLADYGRIVLTGNASVGGTLGAHLAGGYTPNVGDSFAVLNYGAGSVWFTNTSLPVSVLWQTNYSAGVLALMAQGILPLGVTVSPSNQTVAAGSTIIFQASASGPGPFGYQWLRNAVALPGATNASLVLSNVTAAASGAYSVEVSNANGSVLSAAAGLSVLAPPAITSEPHSQTANVGTTVTFLVTAMGSPPLSYQWSFDSQPLPGATNVNLTLTNVTRARRATTVWWSTMRWGV